MEKRTVAPGQTITLTVAATDPDPTDVLTYDWTGEAGTFGTPGSATTTWTAPQTPGTYQLVSGAADPTGARATLTITMDVQDQYSVVAQPVVGLSTNVQSLSVGQHSSCATVQGVAYCWGYNYYATLGNGTQTNSAYYYVPENGTSTNSAIPVMVHGL